MDDKFDKLNERTLTTNQLYELFAGWMLNTYKIKSGKNKGKRLGVKSVRNFLNSIIHQVKERFIVSKNPKTILFLQCLDSHDTSEQANWLRGVRKNIYMETLFSKINESRSKN